MKKPKKDSTKKRISIPAIILGVILLAIGIYFIKNNSWIALEYQSSKVKPVGEVISKEHLSLGSYENPKRGSINIKGVQYVFGGTGNFDEDINSVLSQLTQNGWHEFDRWKLDPVGKSFGATYVMKDGTNKPVQVRFFALEDKATIVIPSEAINKTNTTINLDYNEINSKYNKTNGYIIGLLYFTGRP